MIFSVLLESSPGSCFFSVLETAARPHRFNIPHWCPFNILFLRLRFSPFSLVLSPLFVSFFSMVLKLPSSFFFPPPGGPTCSFFWNLLRQGFWYLRQPPFFSAKPTPSLFLLTLPPFSSSPPPSPPCSSLSIAAGLCLLIKGSNFLSVFASRHNTYRVARV